ncbi:sulfurtransferase [Halostella sp. JP-L12]|uniref:sulfurtransferase n=1 Tax=Halostella TaxID=1843185 RepID=UPI000EF7B31D|nr:MULTISPECIES: sulfurtransferase [Halostella]NHN46215.1 sulfurtransferase [Halostella sp. JP-L12]
MTDDIVVSREWLADHLDEVTIVDVRDAWEYDGIGHVPGAVNVPFDEFRSESEETPGMLPGADAFAALMSEAGVAADDTVVAYDDTHGVFAARFLVTAEIYGHGDVRLLDGDYSAWNLEHETTTDVPEVAPTEYAATPPEDSILIDQAAVEAAIDTDAVLVDTRDDWEFEDGHIPGAVNLDWKELVDDETRGLKPRDELEEILGSYGVTPDRRVILYCNTARRISHTYVVLRHLGYEDVAFYEGSLTEWEKADGPLETGV